MSPRCPRCDKPTGICVCDRLTPLSCRTRILVLQHPDEPDEVLGTTRLLQLSLGDRVRVRVGTSWASLAEAWGEPADLRAFGVLWRTQLPRALEPEEEARPYLVLDRGGVPWSGRLDGLIALDGTWSQAKTLWWRNPWLLRQPRVLIQPREASIYGRVRREPRREALSTLEAVAEALLGNGEPPELRGELRSRMRAMVQRARDTAPPGLRRG